MLPCPSGSAEIVFNGPAGGKGQGEATHGVVDGAGVGGGWDGDGTERQVGSAADGAASMASFKLTGQWRRVGDYILTAVEASSP